MSITLSMLIPFELAFYEECQGETNETNLPDSTSFTDSLVL